MSDSVLSQHIGFVVDIKMLATNTEVQEHNGYLVTFMVPF